MSPDQDNTPPKYRPRQFRTILANRSVHVSPSVLLSALVPRVQIASNGTGERLHIAGSGPISDIPQIMVLGARASGSRRRTPFHTTRRPRSIHLERRRAAVRLSARRRLSTRRSARWMRGGLWTVDCGRWMVSEQQTVDCGRWTVNGPWTVVSGHRSVDGGLWTVGGL